MKLLVVRCGSIGDTVLSYPLVQRLRLHYSVTMTASIIEREIVDRFFGVDILQVERNELQFFEDFKEFDFIVSLDYNKGINDRIRQSGVPYSIMPFIEENFDSVEYARKYGVHKVSEIYEHSMFMNNSDDRFKFSGFHYKGGGGYVVVFPHGKRETCSLNEHQVERIVQEVSKKYRCIVITKENGRTLEEIIDLYMKDCEYAVSVDSGFAHLAHALGVPCITLFGSGNPNIWGHTEAKTFWNKCCKCQINNRKTCVKEKMDCMNYDFSEIFR